ncbi:MAG: MotE family protein [Syntrophobacteraceae bacterium]
MKSPSSNNPEEIVQSSEQPPDMPRASRSKKTLSLILSVVALMILLKTGLTLGRFVFGDPSPDSEYLAFPREVLAEDKKGKTPDGAPLKKSNPPSGTTNATVPPLQPMTETLTHIEQREAELKRKEEQLRQKEEYLAKMEQEVEKKLKDLLAIQKEIQAYRSEKEESQNTKIRSLAKIYGTMKPKEAAKLLDNLEEHLVVSVISTMSADEAANILGNMDVKKAAKISESLSHR